MMVAEAEILVTALLLIYAGFSLWRQMHRRARSWSQIVCRLRGNDWGIEEIAEHFLFSSRIRATAQDIWPRITGVHGLWAMYQNAPVLVELADYAAEHGDYVNQELLDGLRSDAFQIRVYVMMALAQHALSASSERASVNAHHAAATYNAMLARLTEFMQEHSALLLPSYLDAVV